MDYCARTGITAAAGVLVKGFAIAFPPANLDWVDIQKRWCAGETSSSIARSRRDMDYAPDRTEVQRVGATRAAITRLDFAQVLITGASLTTLQRNIVWDRADGKMWKQISHLRDTPIRTLQREYFKALAELCAYAIARHKKSLAHIRWRKSGPAVVEFRKAA